MVTTGWLWADWIIAVAALLTAVSFLWAKFVGPFLLKPLARLVRREIEEVVTEKLEPVEHAVDLLAEAFRSLEESVHASKDRTVVPLRRQQQQR